MDKDLLSGKQVRLRALEPADAELLYEWENDPSVWHVSNTVTPYSMFQIEQYILNSQNDLFATRQLRLMVLFTDPAGKGVPAGAIDLFDFDPIHRRAGVGIMLLEAYRSRGLAQDAMEVLVRYAFTTLRLHQLYCNISPDNRSSLALFEKLSFSKCGIKRDWVHNGNAWAEEWMFQLINPDE